MNIQKKNSKTYFSQLLTSVILFWYSAVTRSAKCSVAVTWRLLGNKYTDSQVLMDQAFLYIWWAIHLKVYQEFGAHNSFSQ